MKYKVALTGGRWKYGFDTVEAASAYAGRIFDRRGVIAAVESYRPKGK
jgi:hypothetical protein